MRAFNAMLFLTTAGKGRQMISFRKGEVIYAQGEVSDAVFVIQTGWVRLSSRTHEGKNATLNILGDADFVGKDALAGERVRTASANALSNCQLLRIERGVMNRALAAEVTLANVVCAYVLASNLSYQKDLVDQRCKSSEIRLAGILIQLAHMDPAKPRETMIPKISQGTLAELVGTTRSRVSFFMNGFKNSGFIDYNLKSKEMRLRPSLVKFYEG